MGYVTSQSRGEATNIWLVVSKICVFFQTITVHIYNILYIYICIYTKLNMVGGLEHCYFPYIGDNHPNGLSYFSRGRYTTNQ